MNTRTPRLRFAAALFGAATLALSAATTLTLLAPGTARAQATATTDPVGYLSLPLLANSDTFVSIPFTRPAEFTGAVASVSGSTLTFSGTPGFTANQFAPLVTSDPAPSTGKKTYYAIIGPKNVALTPTLSVTMNSTAVTASAALPADLVVGDQVTVGGLTFTVAAVPSTTSLTLAKPYTGTTASGLAGTYNHSLSEGRYYTVTANDAGSLTVNLDGDSLTPNVTAGTQVSVIPYWTLGTAFPASDVGISFFASSSAFIRTMEILLPNYAQVGTSNLPAGTYYYFNNAWRQFGQAVATSFNDTVLIPDGYFTVRNNSANAANFKPLGGVATKRLSIPLNTQDTIKQDNFVALQRPVAVSLNDTNLISSGAFAVSTSAFLRKDELLTFDNAAAGQRKLPLATYYYFNNGWRQFGRPVTEDHGSDLLAAGGGFIVRKSPATTTSFWVNSPTY